MIGVVADAAEQDIVREFFELFKTPWEFYRRDQRYKVVLCAGDTSCGTDVELLLRYAGSRTYFDGDNCIQTGCRRGEPRILQYRGYQIPIYGDSVTFPGKENGPLSDEDSKQSVAYADRSAGGTVVRIGYDLFREIRSLLETGQPVAQASSPTLELHIAFLRDLITGCGIPLTEIPPVPQGYRFIVCLTHDVDHPSIRRHKWDHTALGFLYRATFGSLLHCVRGELSLRGLLANWAAALKLPLVYLGLASDFWREFADRYMKLESGLRSTYFVIPFADRPGIGPRGPAPSFRAAHYGARDIADSIKKLLSAGCEVGLHGIDAWADSAKGREELKEIRGLTGASDIGVRMHWLYWDQRLPSALEEAGFAYDSTIGYNETLGYRAGTTQVYKPIHARRLLELPLHVMDTALFYSAHLGLSPAQARSRIDQMVENTVRFGGCLTINWHDRSVFPERFWDGCYRDVVQDLKDRGAWFATGGEAVSWFRKRRSVVFETNDGELAGLHAGFADDPGGHLPALQLRMHHARESCGIGAQASDAYIDESVDSRVRCAVAY